jgi:hypothetical protein
VLLLLAGCGGDSGDRRSSRSPGIRKTITLMSAAFQEGEPIPRKYTGEGADVSPPLSWAGLPKGAQELALICDDPDAPGPQPWVHWVVYGIPPDSDGLAEGSVGGAVQGVNSSDEAKYSGPMPPPSHGLHRYQFRLYALSRKLDLKPGAAKEQLLAAMKGCILAEGELIGTYERK